MGPHPVPAVCHDREVQVSNSGCCVGSVQVDGGRGPQRLIPCGGPQMWACFRITGSLLRPHQSLRSTAGPVCWLLFMVEETEAAGSGCRSLLTVIGFNLAPFSSSPIDELVSVATSPRSGVPAPLGRLGRCTGSSFPLHPFYVLQQGTHEADDLGGWLDRVVLSKQVAHILL